LFESLVVAEFKKYYFNQGKSDRLYFWRDNTGNEIDLILDDGGTGIPVEVKSGKTITTQFFQGVQYWQKLTGQTTGFVVYDGENAQKRSSGVQIIPFKKAFEIPRAISE
jgi:predicted AAA+ superfamily ATPase